MAEGMESGEPKAVSNLQPKLKAMLSKFQDALAADDSLKCKILELKGFVGWPNPSSKKKSM